MQKQKNDAAILAVMMAVLGFGLLFWGQNLRLGSARHMVPGFMPMLVALMALALAALMGVKAALLWRRTRRTPAEAGQGTNWGAILGISLGMLAFALLVRGGGLLLASASAVFLASLAQRYSGTAERLALAGGLTASAALIFSWGLALPFRPLPAL